MNTSNPPIEVEQFDVVIPHVRLTVRQSRSEVEYFRRNTPYIQSILGMDCWSYLNPLFLHVKANKSMETFRDRPGRTGLAEQLLVCSNMSEQELEEISLKFERRWWNEIEELSQITGKKIEFFLRAGLRCRYRQLLKFHELHGSSPEEPPTLEKFEQLQGGAYIKEGASK